MGISIKSITIRRVFNERNNLIYQFPAETLLDNIIPDLWPTIIHYENTKIVFGLGNYNDAYPGYRLVNDIECMKGSFHDLFTIHYEQTNSLLLLSDNLENVDSDNYVRVKSDIGGMRKLCINGYVIVFCFESINDYKIAKIYNYYTKKLP